MKTRPQKVALAGNPLFITAERDASFGNAEAGFPSPLRSRVVRKF
jgi:hypothetical protein